MTDKPDEGVVSVFDDFLLKERLALRGFISPEAASGDADESDLPASAELDEAAAAELDREA